MAKKPSTSKDQSDDLMGELFGLVIWVVLAVVILRSFVFQPYRIPSQSMVPTLEVGDFIYVSMYSYGFGPKSFMFDLPVTRTINGILGRDPDARIFGKTPERGDIVVFRTTDQSVPDRVVIKRVVGVPGDTIETRDGILHINGVASTYANCRAAYSNSDPFLELEEGELLDLIVGGSIRRYARTPLEERWCKDPSNSHGLGADDSGRARVSGAYFDETMPSFDGKPGHTHTIADYAAVHADNFAGSSYRQSTVRPGHIFMMGDNRDASGDSRTSSLDQVPLANVIGEAHFTILSLNTPLFQKVGSGEESFVRLLALWDWVRWDRFVRPLI